MLEPVTLCSLVTVQLQGTRHAADLFSLQSLEPFSSIEKRSPTQSITTALLFGQLFTELCHQQATLRATVVSEADAPLRVPATVPGGFCSVFCSDEKW